MIFLLMLLLLTPMNMVGCFASCVTEEVCLLPSPVNNSTENGKCPLALISCDILDPCFRTTEFWKGHVAEWPIEDGSFCFHTWLDILLQDPMQHGVTFPIQCHALASVLITMRLNERLDIGHNLYLPSALTLMDTAEVEVNECCLHPKEANTQSLHQLFTLLKATYSDLNRTYCNDSIPLPLSRFWSPWEIAIATALTLSLLFLIVVTIPIIHHYAAWCHIWNNPKIPLSYIQRTLSMVIHEKVNCYSILNTGDADDDTESSSEDSPSRSVSV